jgi:hypothetical protein
MKLARILTKKTSVAIISTAAIVGNFTANMPLAQAQSIQFECASDQQNIPTTFVQTPNGIVQIFKWTSTFFKPPYTPMQRCLEVTQRLNQFQPELLVAGRVNNYNVICAGSNCNVDGTNVLLTLRPDQSPTQVLAEIDHTRDGAGGPSMQLGAASNGQPKSQSNLIKTANGSVALNLKNYLETAPRIPLRLSGDSTHKTLENRNNSPLLKEEPLKIPSSSSDSAW